MGKIELLADRLISQIAAGEVVERPSSVVKELIENALDAGAAQVQVDLEVGGKRRIVVQDDGVGMDRDDALLAFDRHATSKISSFEDLERVATLGFRGEALATIAAVARVELRTACEPGDGQRVRLEGGRVKGAEPISHPRGTRIEVASLFFNVPARRKFLKRPQTELRQSVAVVEGYALAHPQVRFRVSHEGRKLFETLPVKDGQEGLRERIAQIFGAAFARQLVAIPETFGGGREAISGFVGNRETARGRRQFTFVNRRLLRDRAVLATFYRAVREVWKSDDFPALFLFLDLPPQDVDVNVHPQKAEVRFHNLSFLDRVGEALRVSLGGTRREEDAPLRRPAGRPSAPLAWEGLGGRKWKDRAQDPDPWRALPEEVAEPHERWPAVDGQAAADPVAGAPIAFSDGAATIAVAGDASGQPRLDEPVARIAQATYRPPVARRPIPLSGRSGETRPFRLLGQYKGTLILLEGPDGLYLIDQHVAHERLLYERLRRTMSTERPASQKLLTPPLLELGAAETMRLEGLSAALEACGFTLEPMSGQTIALTGAPAVLKVDEAEALVRELASSASEAVSDVTSLRRQLLDSLAASLACRAAIKMHRPMSVEEMEAVISELFDCEEPYACPHGRPTVLQMTDIELERRFGRR